MTRMALPLSDKPRLERTAAILGIGAATPPSVTQKQTLELAARLTGEMAHQQAWLSRIFLRCGIETRGTVLAGNDADGFEGLRDFYPPDGNPTTAQRIGRYAIEAPILANAAAANALADASIAADAITHLITVSCTGFFAPGLDVALIDTLGLSPSVRRLHIGFMGCHAAFNAMAAARNAVLADPDAMVLVCCVELCSLHFAYGSDPGQLVANALFADGAAAVVLGQSSASDVADCGRWLLHDTSSHLIPDSREAMTWIIGDHGFEMTLSPAVPDLIRQNMRPWCEAWLARHDLHLSDIASWAIHPGGPRILSAVAEALDIPPEALRYSKDILANHGNMSSATILFILRQMTERSAAGPCVAIGLGPGLMAEGMLLKR